MSVLVGQTLRRGLEQIAIVEREIGPSILLDAERLEESVASLPPVRSKCRLVVRTKVRRELLMVFVGLEPAAKVDKRSIDRLQAGGGTDYVPALELAQQTLAKLKGKKHVVLLSDGEAPSDGLVERIHQMRESGITLSTIGIGDADRKLLTTMADAGNGRVYMADDLSLLTKLFVQDVATALPR